MVDFSHLKQLDVTAASTARWYMVELEGRPFFDLHHAGESNKPFFNELVRRTKKASKAVQAGNIGSELLAANRDEDRLLYSKHIITNWGNVVDSDGKAVPYSEANCLEFLKQMPDWLFDKLRQFASNVDNFIGTNETVDVEVASGN